ncbi:MAG: hypothetical protein J6I40_04210, partial [Mailhella sp.]|nr:hypothetical protein [Mailhella sp.]
IQEILDKDFNEVTSAYKNAVEESFMPALNMLAEEEASLSVYVKVLEKMRRDTNAKAEEMLEHAASLERSIQRLSCAG